MRVLAGGGEQEIHVALPRMARRQFGSITGHGAARTVDAGEVHTVHTAYHFAPGVGVDGAVECQILLGSRDERTRHALLFERYARLIEEVVEPVVVPAEPSVCRPDVGREPVVQDVGVVDVGTVAACPDQVPVLRRAFSRVYRAPSVVALLRSDADQTAGTVCPLEPVVPLARTAVGIRSPTSLSSRKGSLVPCSTPPAFRVPTVRVSPPPTAASRSGTWRCMWSL